MECSDCGKDLNDGIISFCEKCERYYCMDCSRKHNNHRLTFARLDNNQLIDINTGVSGAGVGDIHHKFFTDLEWVSRKSKCNHVDVMIESGYPIFLCEDGQLRCFNCFYESGITLTDPLIKVGDERLMWLLPHTYEPCNLNFSFNCDKQAVKGEDINLSLTIQNHKQNPINDINIQVQSFAADPLPDNIPFFEYFDGLYQNYLIFKEFHFDILDPGNDLKIDFKVKIPLDFEIKKEQFCDFSVDEDDKYSNNGFLKLPDNLMIYASFNYKTVSGFRYYSDIEANIIELK